MTLVCVLLAALFTATSIKAEEQNINLEDLRCAVCEAALDKLEKHLSTIKPTREMEVGNYRLDAQGNYLRKKVPVTRSEVYLSDQLESICEDLQDYVRVKDKKTGRIMVLNIFSSSGKMNPLIGNEVDIITDSDMNRSLKYYCERIVEDFEEAIIRTVQEEKTDFKTEVCTYVTKLCPNKSTEESNEEDEDIYNTEL